MKNKQPLCLLPGRAASAGLLFFATALVASAQDPGSTPASTPPGVTPPTPIENPTPPMPANPEMTPNAGSTKGATVTSQTDDSRSRNTYQSAESRGATTVAAQTSLSHGGQRFLT